MICQHSRHLNLRTKISCPSDHPLLTMDWHHRVILREQKRDIPLCRIDLGCGRRQSFEGKWSQCRCPVICFGRR
jgi:hypothetical protein